MNRIAGYTGILLIGLCAVGMLFFRHYTGVGIPYPPLWYLLFLIIGFLGVWLVRSSGAKKMNRENKILLEAVAKLKSGGEKIPLQFDLCDFKSGTYSHEVEDQNLDSVKLIAIGPTAHFYKTTVIENVIQSSLVYRHPNAGKTEKFYSQYFPFDQKTLEFYVMSGNLTLYVDRFDRRRFFFDIQR